MVWVKGLVAALIGGAAIVIKDAIVDPASFDPSQWKRVATSAIVGGVLAVAAYLAKSPLPSGDDSGGQGGPSASAGRPFVVLLLASAIGFGGAACVKKRADETPTQASTRKKAVYTAQSFAALDGWSDLTLVLEKGSVISRDAARGSYGANEKARAALDIVQQRLRDGYPSSQVIPIVETTLDDIDKAEAAGLLGIGDASARTKYQEFIFSLRFGLNSLKAVLAAQKEPSAAEFRARARQAIQPAQTNPPWWTDAILVVQTTLIRFFEQSRMTADEAWADGAAISAALKAVNAERLK